MLVYKDIISGDEIISDSYKLDEVDGIVYECAATMQKVGGAINVNTGANASAEEADEGTDDQAEQKLDIPAHFRLEKYDFISKDAKKEYRSHLKSYMTKVKDALQDRNTPEDTITQFMKGAQAYASKIFANFDNCDFYRGETDVVVNGMLVIVEWREEQSKPYVIVWKNGLEGMKV